MNEVERENPGVVKSSKIDLAKKFEIETKETKGEHEVEINL